MNINVVLWIALIRSNKMEMIPDHQFNNVEITKDLDHNINFHGVLDTQAQLERVQKGVEEKKVQTVGNNSNVYQKMNG